MRDSVSNHQLHDCLLNRLFRRRSKKTSKFRVTGLCAGNSPGTGEFPTQMASYAENVSIWWRYHGNLSISSTAFMLKANKKSEFDIVLWSIYPKLGYIPLEITAVCGFGSCAISLRRWCVLNIKDYMASPGETGILINSSWFNEWISFGWVMQRQVIYVRKEPLLIYNVHK